MGFASILMGAWRQTQADARRDAVARDKVGAFNARLKRLNNIFSDLNENARRRLLDPTVFSRLSASEQARLSSCYDEATYFLNLIGENINTATKADLARYATALKKLALHSIKMCQKYGVFPGVVSIEYVAYKKTLAIDGRDIYCFA